MPKAIATTLTPPTKEQRADNRFKFHAPTADHGLERRRWGIGRVRALQGFGFSPDEALEMLVKHWPGERKEGACEDVVAFVYGTDPQSAGAGSWPEPDVAETERIVGAYPNVNVDTLRQSPRNRASDYTQAQIIEVITYPKQLVCAGLAFNAPTVWPVETLLGKRSDLLPKWEFIVANPMSKRIGRTKGAYDKPPRDYERTDDNACKEENRRWLIVECDFSKVGRDGKPTVWAATIDRWEAQGISVKDAATRVLAHLLTTHQQKVALVVDSSGKSLHCWINARAFGPGKLKEFQDHACKLGADWRSFLLSQWVRFPGGSRRKDDGAVVRQEVLYFDPSACPGNDATSELSPRP
jgi:hypothetical protein